MINVAAHRVSTSGIEEVLSKHPEVANAAVVGVADSIKGHVPVGVLVLRSNHRADVKKLIAELVSEVRARIGPFACFKTCVVVSKLPHTRSGKTLRKTMALILEGHRYSVPPTIEDPTALTELKEAAREQVGIVEQENIHVPTWENGVPMASPDDDAGSPPGFGKSLASAVSGKTRGYLDTAAARRPDRGLRPE